MEVSCINRWLKHIPTFYPSAVYILYHKTGICTPLSLLLYILGMSETDKSGVHQQGKDGRKVIECYEKGVQMISSNLHKIKLWRSTYTQSQSYVLTASHLNIFLLSYWAKQPFPPSSPWLSSSLPPSSIIICLIPLELAKMYIKGIYPIPPNGAKALEYYIKALQLGEASLQRELYLGMFLLYIYT